MFYTPQYKQVSKNVISNRAKIELVKLHLTKPDIEPIIISGNKIATTWWGISWNKNLERYTYIDNRLQRGKSYVLGGAVIDLQITNGRVKAFVVGSKNYEVVIDIKPLANNKLKQITMIINGQIDTIDELLKGNMPNKFKDLFFDQENGLFPRPDEIKMDCNCPDSIHLCKHIAATLYGIGNRFDKDPLLFFKLRSINIDELINTTINNKVDKFIKLSDEASKRTIHDDKIQKLFKLND